MKASLCLLVCFLSLSQAHRALLTGPSCYEDFSTSSTALVVEDPTISWYFDHYLDCASRAIWLQIQAKDTQFYLGAAVTLLERFANVRASALVVGPNLNVLTAEEVARVPAEILNDPAVDTSSALLLEAPQDQSTCDHIGATLRDLYASIEDGRCVDRQDLRAWPVLDVEGLDLTAGEDYHIAIYLQQNEAAKLTIGLGTWQTSFNTPYTQVEPACPRDMTDFLEDKDLNTATCFPAGACPDDGTNIGCLNTTEANCPQARVCVTAEGCTVEGKTYVPPVMGSCGGQRCPGQVHAWEHVNHKMHMGMMNLEYTGNAAIDFVRGMIPHHQGAVDMCEILLTNLTCTPLVDVVASDSLQGLEHFCSHIRAEQSIEVGAMRDWLVNRDLPETAPCPTAMGRDASGMHGGHHATMTPHNMEEMMHMSCGVLDKLSSKAFIEVNHQMMAYMAIEYSCDPLVDFVRGMMPHHEAAIGMCNVMVDSGVQDNFLLELCTNITYTQYAEISWMHTWLDARGYDQVASCRQCEDHGMHGHGSHGHGDGHGHGDDVGSTGMSHHNDGGGIMDAETAPCEDLLPTSSFCHDMGGGSQADGTCKCGVTIDTFACGTTTDMGSFGLFATDAECMRTCGLCPQRSSLFGKYCPMEHARGNMTGGDDLAGRWSVVGSLLAAVMTVLAAF